MVYKKNKHFTSYFNRKLLKIVNSPIKRVIVDNEKFFFEFLYLLFVVSESINVCREIEKRAAVQRGAFLHTGAFVRWGADVQRGAVLQRG